jgi:hypothetical protein
MTIFKLTLLVGIVVLSTACPKYRPVVNFKNPGSFVNELNGHLKDAQHNYECYRFGPAHIDAQGKSCAGFVQDLNKAKAVRNELLENALPFIDEAYADFVTDLQAGRDRANFVREQQDRDSPHTARAACLQGPCFYQRSSKERNRLQRKNLLDQKISDSNLKERPVLK